MTVASHIMEGYLRNTFEVRKFTQAIERAARDRDFTVEHVDIGRDTPLVFCQRLNDAPKANLYISAGMHGDEPAGPLTLLRMLLKGEWLSEFSITMIPLLNPAGMALNQRDNPEGLDINRDYKRFQTPEARAHVEWLKRLPKPRFDLCINLHEDWEAKGYYIYEVNPDREQSVAPPALHAVRPIVGVEEAMEIDGHPADNGIIRPAESEARGQLRGDDWPETLYLMDHHTRHSYTFETPSNSDLAHRISAHEAAVQAALQAVVDNGHWFEI